LGLFLYSSGYDGEMNQSGPGQRHRNGNAQNQAGPAAAKKEEPKETILPKPLENRAWRSTPSSGVLQAPAGGAVYPLHQIADVGSFEWLMRKGVPSGAFPVLRSTARSFGPQFRGRLRCGLFEQ